MGSWGDGPFDNDQAMDVIDDLAQMGADERRARLHELFAAVFAPAPAGTEVPFWPKEVIAAASLVALVLPGGSVVLDPQSSDDYVPDDDAEWTDALLTDPGEELIRAAGRALEVVADPESKWFTDWVCGDDDEAAWLANIVRVLHAGTNREA
ncbi:DUF4259 domain-containing protein [Actinoplanes subglobosus]|uniref:DUF4259 domain-containing protein n=1 Tax=Actinoplanes subglobosus TaxID=1547892 RepID=A0ABV8IK87_9ACTN